MEFDKLYNDIMNHNNWYADYASKVNAVTAALREIRNLPDDSRVSDANMKEIEREFESLRRNYRLGYNHARAQREISKINALLLNN